MASDQDWDSSLDKDSLSLPNTRRLWLNFITLLRDCHLTPSQIQRLWSDFLFSDWTQPKVCKDSLITRLELDSLEIIWQGVPLANFQRPLLEQRQTEEEMQLFKVANIVCTEICFKRKKSTKKRKQQRMWTQLWLVERVGHVFLPFERST